MFQRKKEKSEEKRVVKRNFEEILELPKEVISNQPKITIIGFEQMMIENYKGILEYEEFFIKLNTHIGVMNINGFNMKLEQMTTDDMMITGKIESIDFESTT